MTLLAYRETAPGPQPHDWREPDWSNPLSRGLVYSLAPWAQRRNLLSKATAPTIAGPISAAGSPFGRAVGNGSANAYINTGSGWGMGSALSGALAMILYPYSSGGSFAGVRSGGWILDMISAAPRFTFAGVANYLCSANLPTGQWCVFGVTWRQNGTSSFWLNGNRLGNTFTAGTMTTSGGNLFLNAEDATVYGAAWFAGFHAFTVPKTDDEMSLLTHPDTFWDVLEPDYEPVIYSLGAAVPTLTIADIAHAHLADALGLTQVHQLAVADAAHAQPVDAPSLTQTHQLAVADATHGQAVDALDLTQLHQLVVQDATHAHPTDALTLTQTHLLAVADALHVHAVDHLSLSGVVTLAINDALHGHLADGLTLQTSATLQIADILHAHAADALALGQVHVLVVADAVHAQLVDAVALSLPGAVLAGERALVIPTETRALVVVAESRALAIAAEVRALTVH